MPINRRNVGSDLIRKTMMVSEEAVAGAGKAAMALKVSQGSLVDTAIKYFIGLPQDEIVALMLKYDRLTPDEAGHILKLLGDKTK